MPENPLKFISRYPVDGFEKRPRRAFSEDELSRLLAAIPEEYKLVYLMAVFTGLRRGELMALEWGTLVLIHRNRLFTFGRKRPNQSGLIQYPFESTLPNGWGMRGGMP
jgi:integrase